MNANRSYTAPTVTSFSISMIYQSRQSRYKILAQTPIIIYLEDGSKMEGTTTREYIIYDDMPHYVAFDELMTICNPPVFHLNYGMVSGWSCPIHHAFPVF